MSLAFTPDLRQQYETLYGECVIKPARLGEIDSTIDQIVSNTSRYQDVSSATGVPWYVISVIHYLEASLRFDENLANGDPLTARTVNVPAGRPPLGNPPFSWRDAAIDALQYQGLDSVTDWSVGHVLYLLEGYNGYGYHFVDPPINSPYLWSFSNLYTRGKYTSDGHYDPNAVSDQLGAALILKRMNERGVIAFFVATPISLIFKGMSTTVPGLLINNISWIGAAAFVKLINGKIVFAGGNPMSIQIGADARLITLAGLNIGGTGYVQARQLADALGYDVNFDANVLTLS
jgi:lysozyme family protein